ncbi:hypothetical protein F0562_016178 [Nyssa sinensis]|uniref:Uncharacterized protein n=1 Tax=Nyssa sinensis TaxID=561372 RepID=A0A5J4ZN13_9ASTE|nr:hypothetical protein F0562_016178 [Nyssa sinensis]
MASLLSFSLPKPKIIKASVTTPTLPETLDQKFGRKGIKFLESGDVPSVELTVRNGSSVRLRIPDGHVTSYKPKVYWKDDGSEEVLYTLPANGSANAKGGIALVINEVSEANSKASLVNTSEWTVKDVDSDSIDALQVELSCISGTLDISYVVSLYPLSMATAVIVKNNGRKAVNLTSAILSHFKFKKRGGTAIQGLRGCSYCTHPPISSPFEILSPSEAMKSEDPGWFSFGSDPEKKPGVWTAQDVPITILKNKLSRVYAAPPTERLKGFYNTPPSKYETIDQGRELVFRVIRIGFQDIYLSSPGSSSQKYGKDYFICTGPASMLVPVVVNPVASVSYPPINVDYLDSEFSGHGVSFAAISDCCVVKMGLDNRSVANLMLPSGLITSYKAPMWHGGTLELLHTLVSEGESGGAIIQGGVSLAFKCERDGGVSWSPSTWALNDVRGNPQEFIQVELISRNSKDMIEVKHIVTLQQDHLSSELVICNSNSSSLSLMGSVISHLTVSTPEATYAIGLEGSNFFSRPPLSSCFSIIPADVRQRKDSGSGKLWSPTALKGLLFGWGARNQKNGDDAESRERLMEEEMEGEETDNYKHLAEKMSRIYTSAPQYMTVIDRGRRCSAVLGRDGFNELYMFSPGSSHKWYGKYAYICIGQSALLEPIILGPEGIWRGWQHIYNPNL